MIEVRRGLYCNEAAGEPLPGFLEVATKLARAIASALTLQGWARGAPNRA